MYGGLGLLLYTPHQKTFNRTVQPSGHRPFDHLRYLCTFLASLRGDFLYSRSNQAWSNQAWSNQAWSNQAWSNCRVLNLAMHTVALLFNYVSTTTISSALGACCASSVLHILFLQALGFMGTALLLLVKRFPRRHRIRYFHYVTHHSQESAEMGHTAAIEIFVRVVSCASRHLYGGLVSLPATWSQHSPFQLVDFCYHRPC